MGRIPTNQKKSQWKMIKSYGRHILQDSKSKWQIKCEKLLKFIISFNL